MRCILDEEIVFTYLIGRKGPGGELHWTDLNVEGEVFQFDGACGLVDGRGHPQHCPIVGHNDIRLVNDVQDPVSVIHKDYVGLPNQFHRYPQNLKSRFIIRTVYKRGLGLRFLKKVPLKVGCYLDTVVVRGVPLQLEISPVECQPYVRLHNLALLRDRQQLNEGQPKPHLQ